MSQKVDAQMVVNHDVKLCKDPVVGVLLKVTTRGPLGRDTPFPWIWIDPTRARKLVADLQAVLAALPSGPPPAQH